MLPEWRLNQVRAAAGKWLKDSCTIEQQTIVTGEYGEEASQWSVIATDVKCRVIRSARNSGSATQERGAQETLEQEYKLAVPVSVDLGINQRVTVNGVTYQIVRVEIALTDEIFKSATIVRR